MLCVRVGHAGISPLDVHPQSWAHLPSFEQEMEHRKAKLEAMKARMSAIPAWLGL